MNPSRRAGAGRHVWAALASLGLSLFGWLGWTHSQASELERLRARVEALELERDSLLERLSACRLELSVEQGARLAREQEWLEYTRVVAGLGGDSLLQRLPAFGPQVPVTTPPDARNAAGPSVEELARGERDEAARLGLRTLLAAEGVRGLDLLTLEGVGNERAGPALFRLVDGSGHLSGSLFAAGVRLEGSLAGRTLTLVLEDGYESHGGERVPFGSAAEPEGPPPWRLVLQNVDPRPWLDDLEPLFGAAPLDLPSDDGRWDLAWVTLKLNELLRRDTASGWYRVRRVGGVEGAVLRDVHVEVSTGDGTLRGRIFADRLTLSLTDQGVVLTFQDGVHAVGEERTPFPGSIHRVYLPGARREEWQAAILPGLVDEPSGPAAAGPARSRR